MRKTIYVVCAFTLAFLLGISFLFLLFSLFRANQILAWVILSFFVFASGFLLTDGELIQDSDA